MASMAVDAYSCTISVSLLQGHEVDALPICLNWPGSRETVPFDHLWIRMTLSASFYKILVEHQGLRIVHGSNRVPSVATGTRWSVSITFQRGNPVGTIQKFFLGIFVADQAGNFWQDFFVREFLN